VGAVSPGEQRPMARPIGEEKKKTRGWGVCWLVFFLFWFFFVFFLWFWVFFLCWCFSFYFFFLGVFGCFLFVF